MFYRVISVYRKTVMIVINSCNRLVTVLNIIMYGAFLYNGRRYLVLIVPWVKCYVIVVI